MIAGGGAITVAPPRGAGVGVGLDTVAQLQSGSSCAVGVARGVAVGCGVGVTSGVDVGVGVGAGVSVGTTVGSGVAVGSWQ
jgi:hypothetical protein